MSSITRWKSVERGTEINAYSRTHSTHVLMVLESDQAVPSAAQWWATAHTHPSIQVRTTCAQTPPMRRTCNHTRLRACVQVRASVRAQIMRACMHVARVHARCVRACQVACEGARYVRARVRAQMMRACVRVRECVRVSACVRVRECVRACVHARAAQCDWSPRVCTCLGRSARAPTCACAARACG